MKKGKRVNLNPSSSFDMALAKMSAKERGKAMAAGEMPDQWDVDNIDNELRLFEAKFPGLIRRMANDVAKEIQATKITKHAVLYDSSEFKRSFWLPAPLQAWMEQAYPTFWVSKKHISWFCRHYPIFAYETYTKRYKTK